jgi:hypothetical protein
MAQLTLAGLSDDGKRLLLVDDSGKEFTLQADDALRAALRGERNRIGQLEIQMESNLRPRDIQARIRAGETPEAVASAAQTTVDKIMPFAAPVLAERAHVAQRAQLGSVRRRGGDQGARTLGEAVEAQLRSHNVDPESVEWDAWRREDGRWTLTAEFAGSSRSGTASFSFDTRGNFVTTDDEDARWLVGDVPAAPEAPAAVPGATGTRHLGVVPNDELPLGEDTISMVGAEQPVEAFLPEQTPAAQDEGTPTEETTEIPAAQEERPAAQEPPARKPRKRGRASVPSWDEIMFGGGKGE